MPSLKRVVDVVLAAGLLVLLAPLGIGIALAIWWEDGRPVLFVQTRCGQGGAPFSMLKFRSLRHGPKDPTRPADHTTRVGRVLRRWALDEMPQLWNVLCGDMSLVGPRPALPRQVDAYGLKERERLRVRPGLTGWAQVHGRNALSWPERIDLDRWYVENRSLTLDLSILLQTPLVLLRGTGVNGPQGRNASFGDPPDLSSPKSNVPPPS